jgi:hypothetical protein
LDWCEGQTILKIPRPPAIDNLYYRYALAAVDGSPFTTSSFLGYAYMKIKGSAAAVVWSAAVVGLGIHVLELRDRLEARLAVGW